VATTEANPVTARAVAEVLELFAEDQPDGYIALEFIVSSRISDAVSPGSKLARAIRLAETNLPRQGFQWLETGNHLNRLVQLTRAELERTASPGQREELLASLLHGDPAYLERLKLPEA